MNAPLIRFEAVRFAYAERTVLDGVDLSVNPGDRVALVGANGTGKSTLLHLIVGLRRPSAGRIHAFGERCVRESDFQAVRRRVGLLFQDSDDQLFCPTVIEDVAFGPLNLGLGPDRARVRALETLASLGIEDFAGRITHRLSGGEKRLVALATVLAMRPEVLLLDEPTNGLDERTEGLITAYLQALPMAMILVAHDYRFLGRIANRAVLLEEGRLLEGALHSHPHIHTHEHTHIHALPADPHGAAVPPHDHPHEV